MALPNEPKIKLNLKTGFSIGSQPTQSPPIGLKINHGKPNYKINRGLSRSESVKSPSNSSQSNPFGVTLKKTPSMIKLTDGKEKTNGVNGNTQSSQVSLKPVITSRNFTTPPKAIPISSWSPNANGPKQASQVILKSASRSTYLTGSQNDCEEEPEFLRAHRKMAAKISNVDYEDISKNRNSYTEIMNVSSPRSSAVPNVPEVEPVPEHDAASNVVVIENGQESAVSDDDGKHQAEENGCDENEKGQTVCNGDSDEKNSPEKEETTDEVKISAFAEQLNELIARGPRHGSLDKENIQQQIDQTIEEAFQEVIKQDDYFDENGNTLPEDLVKLKSDIQEEQGDNAVTTTVSQ